LRSANNIATAASNVNRSAGPRRGATEPFARARSFQQEQYKRQPPHQIVEYDEGEGAQRPFAGMNHHQPAHRPENFSCQSDRYGGTRAIESPSGITVERAIETHHHAETLPESRVIRRRQLEAIKEQARPQIRPQTEGDVIDDGETEEQSIKFCAVFAHDRSISELARTKQL
jgi:hypothetical protein